MAQGTDSARTFHRGHEGLQSHMERGMMGIPNLHWRSKSKNQSAADRFRKEALPLQNQLEEKRAASPNLQTAQAYDANAVNATIDDIAKTESS